MARWWERRTHELTNLGKLNDVYPSDPPSRYRDVDEVRLKAETTYMWKPLQVTASI